MNKLLVIDVAGLGYQFINKILQKKTNNKYINKFKPLNTVFPAVTCTVQASFKTASFPSIHGMVANGLFFRDLYKTAFWEQSSRLVNGERFWTKFRSRGKRVGILFWQQTLGENIDFLLSPAPIHKHNGGMIQDCYSLPGNLYNELCKKIGRPFKLSSYWGPLASEKSTEWIVSATEIIMSEIDLAPELLLVYLPHLDYDLQKYGPENNRSIDSGLEILNYISRLNDLAQLHGYEIVIFGDYAMTQVINGAILPNLLLKKAGLFQIRKVEKMLYPDFYQSRAFALADHEIAHIFIQDKKNIDPVASVFEKVPGIEKVIMQKEYCDLKINHTNSGELILIAGEGHWFAYPWWKNSKEAPDYANHVDIHNKPGYDPCELFFGRLPFNITQDLSKVKGTHGRTDPDRQVAWMSTCKFTNEPSSIVELAQNIQVWLEEKI